MKPEERQEELARAVAEYYHSRAQEDELDPEHLRLVLLDLRSSLGPEDWPDQSDLLDESRLFRQLQDSYPCRVAAEEMPEQLEALLARQPPPKSQDRPMWLDKARRLFERASPNRSEG